MKISSLETILYRIKHNQPLVSLEHKNLLKLIDAKFYEKGFSFETDFKLDFFALCYFIVLLVRPPTYHPTETENHKEGFEKFSIIITLVFA